MKTMFLVGILVLFTSCDGPRQKSSESIAERTVAVSIGDTVADLGKDIDCIVQDKNGNYWFASNGGGAYRYDGHTLTHITEKDGLCSNFVRTIQVDMNGDLWFSTRDGVCRFNGSTFADYTSAIEHAPNGRLRHTRGEVFFGHSNGICYYDGLMFTNFAIHPDTYRPSGNDMNRPYSVYSTLVDKAGNVWFGTESGGVCRYDGRTFSYLTDKDLAGAAVRAIFQDKAGNLWFGNNGGGLYRFDGETLTNITEEKGLGNPVFLKDRRPVSKPGTLARVWAINEDREGNLWIGTIDAGAWKFDGIKLTNYTTNDGLPGNAIWTIFRDNRDELWFVTNGDAVCRFDGTNFTKYDFH